MTFQCAASSLTCRKAGGSSWQQLQRLRPFFTPYSVNVAAVRALEAALDDHAYLSAYVAATHDSRARVYDFCRRHGRLRQARNRWSRLGAAEIRIDGTGRADADAGAVIDHPSRRRRIDCRGRGSNGRRWRAATYTACWRPATDRFSG